MNSINISYDEFRNDPEIRKNMAEQLEILYLKEGKENKEELLFSIINNMANIGLKNYNKKNILEFNISDYCYRMVLEEAEKEKIDVSKYPKTLEELIN